MSTDDPNAATEGLQFDRVSTDAPATGQTPSALGAVVCKLCGKPISSDYYHLNGKIACESCRTSVAAGIATPEGILPFARATALGILAALAGAALYYGVIAIANLEIGIIAIAIGYMVGWGVRKGADGRGGLRFQILAVVLTYWAVGLAYAPLILKHSTMPLPLQFLYVFQLPILVITSGGTGFITAIIIAVGLRQAWRMTAAPTLKIEGPYRIGSGAGAAVV
ncbi:MAG TPA: hypothetical protein VGO46_17055 [Gemmatimonadaceae bacterium]|nr:hypothetical protein [Gemmatimonadaceae bacterium]